MQRLLQSNPTFANLLKAPTPVVSSTPPAPTAGSATLTWNANVEPDLGGYKVYVGTASGTYSFSGSPFTVGKATTYTVNDLPLNNTYFFAVSAYDNAGNEGPLSVEVSKSIF
jgi:fibronectin type III domain protein